MTVTKRVVSDILTLGGAPVAFIEVAPRTDEQPGTYVAVCPWCGNDIGVVHGVNYGGLYDSLFELTAKHIPKCVAKERTVADGLAVELRSEEDDV